MMGRAGSEEPFEKRRQDQKELAGVGVTAKQVERALAPLAPTRSLRCFRNMSRTAKLKLHLTKPRLRASFPIAFAIPSTTSRADSGFVVSLNVVHNSLSSLIEKIVVST